MRSIVIVFALSACAKQAPPVAASSPEIEEGRDLWTVLEEAGDEAGVKVELSNTADELAAFAADFNDEPGDADVQTEDPWTESDEYQEVDEHHVIRLRDPGFSPNNWPANQPNQVVAQPLTLHGRIDAWTRQVNEERQLMILDARLADQQRLMDGIYRQAMAAREAAEAEAKKTSKKSSRTVRSTKTTTKKAVAPKLVLTRADDGYLVSGMTDQLAASKTGLRNGDVLTQLVGKPARTVKTADAVKIINKLADSPMMMTRDADKVVLGYKSDVQPVLVSDAEGTITSLDQFKSAIVAERAEDRMRRSEMRTALMKAFSSEAELVHARISEMKTTQKATYKATKLTRAEKRQRRKAQKQAEKDAKANKTTKTTTKATSTSSITSVKASEPSDAKKAKSDAAIKGEVMTLKADLAGTKDADEKAALQERIDALEEQLASSNADHDAKMAQLKRDASAMKKGDSTESDELLERLAVLEKERAALHLALEKDGVDKVGLKAALAASDKKVAALADDLADVQGELQQTKNTSLVDQLGFVTDAGGTVAEKDGAVVVTFPEALFDDGGWEAKGQGVVAKLAEVLSPMTERSVTVIAYDIDLLGGAQEAASSFDIGDRLSTEAKDQDKRQMDFVFGFVE